MTQQQKVDAHQRTLDALTLRKAGVPYQEIANALGYKTPQAAWVAVKRALRKTIQEPANELRTLEHERLDAALKAIWPDVQKGSYGAIDRAIKIMERKAKLLGLDKQPAEGPGSEAQPFQHVIRIIKHGEPTDAQG